MTARQFKEDARPLSLREIAGLSPGLWTALRRAGADPRIVSRAHPGARIAALWRGRAPILARGDLIFWPAAPEDAAACGDPRLLALLQHELQHVLDYARGELTALGYLSRPKHWSYRWPGAAAWDELGVEQRAVAAERLRLAQSGLLPASEIPRLEALIPWAPKP